MMLVVGATVGSVMMVPRSFMTVFAPSAVQAPSVHPGSRVQAYSFESTLNNVLAPHVVAASDNCTNSSWLLGRACCTLAAGLAILARGSRRRGAGQRRTDVVLRRMHPSGCGRPRQKVLRRLEPFGQIPAWTTKPLLKRRLLLPWRIRVTPRPSVYKREMIEKQRIRFHYNIKDYQLREIMKEAFKKGVEYPCDRALQILESRLDCFVWRVGLAPTMAAARWMVVRGAVQVLFPEENKGDYDRIPRKFDKFHPPRNPNDGGHGGYCKPQYKNDWTTSIVPATRLEVGCQVRVSPQECWQKHGKLAHEKEPNVELPANITWDRETLQGSYLDICDWQEFSIHVDEQHFLNWFKMPQGVRRTHKRYFLGTNILIKKKYTDGRIRPTPENILNMKRGLGLNSRGRSRPPSLWGRRHPINNPSQAARRQKFIM